MSGNSRLEELLDRWEDLRKLRHTVSPEELCRESPELLDELRQRIQDLESIDAFITTQDHQENHHSTPNKGGRSPVQLPYEFGRYRILKSIGRGGMGARFLAHDTP